ncbi:MAG TPA: mandelate racemase/muconate lactonizing enzyme family protein [Rhodospirillales bacterium]|jgi:D-arabinonate dehydratase|nr:mandelate racemase/muconate lactonizing enzyme family protein [Rhodospirillales bacterium]HJO68540.1 mandelate racemase/muconate lactonizing enzyme family protein [Rhodospirillales bacterium]
MPRIETIEAFAIRIPLKRTFGLSSVGISSRAAVVTRLVTDDGLKAEVYNGDNRAHARDIAKIVEDELAPLCIGAEVTAVERIWETMFAVAAPARDRKLVLEAIACVDTAIWDALGQSLGLSVSKLLGGYCDALPIIAIGGYYEDGKSPAEMAAEMAGLRARGLAGCKVKVGGLAPEADADRIAAAREGGGEGFVIAADANRGWGVDAAIRFARLVEPYGLAWFEEPCHWYDDAAAMARVRQACTLPICAGQSEITSHGVRRLLEAGAVDMVNFDASESGGITEWRRSAAMCSVFGVRLGHHEEPQIALHLLSAYANGSFVECFADPERDPIWEGIVTNRPAIADGVIRVPDGPGFDIRLDQDALRHYRWD